MSNPDALSRARFAPAVAALALALLPALSAPALAQDAPSERPPDGSVTLDPIGVLPEAAEAPVAFAAAGKPVLYTKRIRGEEGSSYVYSLWEGGEDAVEIFAGGIQRDDSLTVFLSPGAISSGGDRFLLAAEPEKRQFQATLVSPEGQRTLVTPGPITGLGWAGEDAYALTGSFSKAKDVTSALVRFRKGEGEGETVASFKGEMGFGLRLSPDGAHAAFLVIDPSQRRTAQVRIVTLASGQSVDSPPARMDDVTFDGAPVIGWAGQRVLYHALPETGGKRAAQISALDLKGKAKPVLERPHTWWGTLDDDRIVVRDTANERAAILRLSTGKRYLLPTEGVRYVLGGRGDRLAILGRIGNERRSIRIYRFALSDEPPAVPADAPPAKEAPGVKRVR